jgi:AraC-like DNA-binding protein
MNKSKIIIYCPQFSDCPLIKIILKSDFITETVGTLEELLKKIKTFNTDAIIECFCEAREENITDLLPLESIPNLIPLIVCSRTYSSDFVFAIAKNGVDYFIRCSQNRAKIVNNIKKIIQHGGVRKFFDAYYPDSFSFSPYTNKIIKIIISTLPNRLDENEFAKQIGVSSRWFRKLCIHVFKLKFSKLMLRIWIYQALRLMQLTNFDNTEIALLLNYSEEGSMVRDFRKELGYTPTKARKLLTNEKPEDMLKL